MNTIELSFSLFFQETAIHNYQKCDKTARIYQQHIAGYTVLYKPCLLSSEYMLIIFLWYVAFRSFLEF